MGLRHGEPQPGADPRKPESAVPEPDGAPLPGRDPVLRAGPPKPSELPGDDLRLHARLRERPVHGRVRRADDRVPALRPRARLARVHRGPPPPRLRRRRPGPVRPPPQPVRVLPKRHVEPPRAPPPPAPPGAAAQPEASPRPELHRARQCPQHARRAHARRRPVPGALGGAHHALARLRTRRHDLHRLGREPQRPVGLLPGPHPRRPHPVPGHLQARAGCTSPDPSDDHVLTSRKPRARLPPAPPRTGRPRPAAGPAPVAAHATASSKYWSRSYAARSTALWRHSAAR